MKKRILLITLMVALLACLFIISASAIEYDKTETVTVTLSNGTTQQCALYDNDGDALVWYTTDSGATVVSVKTKDLYSDTNGAKLVESTNLTHIYLDAETPLQKQNDNTTNKIVVANLRDCTFAGIYHYGYKTTFSNSTIVQYVYLPSTVEVLDCNSFQSCSNLKVCDFPSDASFTINSANNFNGCTSLIEINLIGCTQIKGSICHSNFLNCKALTKVVIDPATINWPSIGGNEFANCPLTQFGLIPGECTIPATTTSIGDNGFQKSRFTKVNMGSSLLASIGYNAFETNPNLTEISFPTTLTTLNIRIFKDCPALTTLIGLENTQITTLSQETFYRSGLSTVTLPSTCTTIGYKALADDVKDGKALNTKLTSITIPAGVILIDDYAFQNAHYLATVTFLGNAGANAVIDTAAFENCKALTSIVLPEGIKTLNNCAFKGCSTLASVTLPTTLTNLGGGEHFYNTALTEVIGLENTQITSIPYSMFRGLSKWQPDVIRLPNTVTSIAQYGFADVGMKSIYLGAVMETLGTEAFINCKNLAAVYLPSTLTSINSSAFSNKLRSDIVFFVTSADIESYIPTVQTGTQATARTPVSYETYLQDTTLYGSGRWLIYGLNTCDTFYDGVHTLDPEQSNACAGICAKCAELSLSANPEHVEKVVITCADLTKIGTKVTTCENANCPYHVSEEIPAVFTYVGVSADMATHQFVTVGYLINQD
ncbi:MAG: leucine-rich repeat protein, partial [Clostridia bacterium]|nr:leucine-rich repeat protein [Clostridia bacterium]